MIHNLGLPMAILLPLALLSALGWPSRSRFDQQIQGWTVAALPGDWRSIQACWELFHTIRTFSSIAALVAATISATIAARPNEPPVKVSPQRRVVAGDRLR
jgi:hypothetical protein